MDRDKLKSVEKRLQEEKQKLTGMIDKIEETGIHQALGESTGELSAYDNHPADLGSEVFERGKDIALCDNENALIADIDRALAKINAGSYGICDICHAAIPDDRLAALPWAVTCVSCQQQADATDTVRRPIEEYSLQNPFVRTFQDHAAEQPIGFDGEDSLQAVLTFGSSDSPQDLPGSHDFSDLNIDPHEQVGIVDPADKIPAHLDGSPDSFHTPNRKRKHYSD